MADKHTKNLFILPVCLLVLNAIEEVAVYKLGREIVNPHIFTGALILMFTAGFALVGDQLAPYLQKLVDHGRKGSRRHGGKTGMFLFYLAVALGLYFAYYTIYVHGPEKLLPIQWR